MRNQPVKVQTPASIDTAEACCTCCCLLYNLLHFVACHSNCAIELIILVTSCNMPYQKCHGFRTSSCYENRIMYLLTLVLSLLPPVLKLTIGGSSTTTTSSSSCGIYRYVMLYLVQQLLWQGCYVVVCSVPGLLASGGTLPLATGPHQQHPLRGQAVQEVLKGRGVVLLQNMKQ